MGKGKDLQAQGPARQETLGVHHLNLATKMPQHLKSQLLPYPQAHAVPGRVYFRLLVWFYLRLS